MKYIDLTHCITHAMPAFPGDPKTTLTSTQTIKVEGYQNSTMQIGMHTGTHVDGPLHVIENSPTINDMNLSKFIGQGIIIDLTGEHNPIEKLQNLNLVDSIALLYTGYSQYFYDDSYFTNYPAISPELIDFLLQKKVKIIGMDTPSPDYSPYNQHAKILGAGVCMIENLTNLHLLKNESNFEIIALPLKINADSAPARVIARLTHH